MKIRMPFVLLLLVLCCESSAIAQEKRSLPERILHSVAKHEKHWKPKANNKVSAMAMAGFDLVYMQWQSGNYLVDALMYMHSSVDEAKQMFSKVGPELGPSFGAMRKVDERVPNLGADNYTWEDIHWKGQQGVVFRKGRVFVIVSAYSMADATKLASYIVRELDP